MKILIRNADSVVIYAQDDLVLTDDQVHGQGWRDHNFNTSNATITDAVLPDLWTGAIWSYINGVWAVVDQARFADLQSQRVKERKEVNDLEAAKTYAKLKALQQMSPAEIQTWVTNNVVTLAQARDALCTLAIAVSILARRL